MPAGADDLLRNIPHAATISRRIEARLSALAKGTDADTEPLFAEVARLVERLDPYGLTEVEPDHAEASTVAREAAEISRRMVDEIERAGLADDRLGQAVRNLFECLGLAKEGLSISLRAGENPASLMRPG